MVTRRSAPRTATPKQRSLERDALENARLAHATGAASAEVLAAAIASLGPVTVSDGIAALQRLGPALEKVLADGSRAVARRPARLEPRLTFEPELARVRPDLSDHEIRGKLLFRDLVGRRSFFQVAAWSIAGLELSANDACLLEQLGVNTQLQDPHIWPLAVARRIAARGGPLARSVIGGVAALFTPGITVEPVGAFMRFLDEVQSAKGRGMTTGAFVAGELHGGRRIAGFGRPVLGPDERVPHALRLARRHRRATGESVRLARAVERELVRSKGLVLNSAGVQGAIMRDMGFTPDAAVVFCALYFVVPLLAQHAFVAERSASRSGASAAAPSTRRVSDARRVRQGGKTARRR